MRNPKRPRGRPRRLRGTFITTTVSLAEPTYLRMRHLAVDEKVSVRDLIRRAVDEFMARRGKEAKR